MTVRRTLLVLGLLVVGASVSQAQSYLLMKFRQHYTDYELGAPPCPSVHPVIPSVYDDELWFTWTCNDGRVIVRGPSPVINVYKPSTASCDASKAIGTTGLNECEWQARYPR